MTPTYRERPAKLKDKTRPTHTIKKDKRNRPVFINKNYRIKIKLKCYGSNKFILKTKQIIVKFVPREISYDNIHLLARVHFNIPKSTNEYNGKNISETFVNIEIYTLTKKSEENKNSLHLHYPKSYTRLTVKKILRLYRGI